MKKVCKVNENDLKILKELHQNPEGLRVNTLIKLTNLKQRTIYKRLNLLKEKNLTENTFPIWKIVNGQVGICAKLLKSDNIFELHNPAYVVKLIRKPDWWSKRKNRLIKIKGWQFKNISFGKGSSNPYQQLINENFVIQTYPESIIVIHRKRYFSNNPFDTAIEMMTDFYNLWNWFEERMRFKFFIDGVPQAELRGNDFNRLKDSLAEHCKKEGRRFLVEIDKYRKVWVDYSEPFGKEANYPEAQEKLEKVTKDLLLKESLLPSQLTERIKFQDEWINHLSNENSEFKEKIKELSEDNILLSQLLEQMNSNLIKITKEVFKRN